jgi:DNA-binding SARP family transcriptional activator
VFGRPRIVSAAGATLDLDRRTAACLAFLGVEGASARAHVSELLWPDAGSGAQRANLRQLARRLRVSFGSEVLTSDDPIVIDVGVHVDVRRFQGLSAASDWRNLSEVSGRLLAGMEFDDCPAFDEWLEQTRTRTEWMLAHAIAAESARLEQNEGSQAAVPLLLRWLEVDPTSEDAYRRLMRAHFAKGDRGAALAVYDACKKTLARALDVDPSRATRALAEEIEGTESRGPASGRTSREQPPLSVLRPPLLVGRRAAWAELEDTLRRGKLALLTGPAGIGKTRLAEELSAAHPELETRYVGCRPNDRVLPYIYFTRTWRHDLTKFPERSTRMPSWVREELARILPELGSPPPPISSDAERVRFFEANLAMAKSNDWPLLMVTDDAHHLDRASHELGLYLAMHFVSTQSRLRSISTYRWDELDDDVRDMLEALITAGEAVRTELTGLGEAEIAELLGAMDARRLGKEADAVHAFTGGNPFYVVEMVKALWGSEGALDLPNALTASERLRLVMDRRLAQLPRLALDLLRAAAILDEPLRLSLASGMLDATPEGIGAAWSELEHGFLRDGVVVHELLRTLVVENTPVAERLLLHCRAARTLTLLGAHPGKIAAHWEQAGERDEASAAYERAAQHSSNIGRELEAGEFRTRALRLRRH